MMDGDCGHGWGYHDEGASGPCSACEREEAKMKNGKLIKVVDSRFKSGNSIPVERAYVTKKEWDQILGLLMGKKQ